MSLSKTKGYNKGIQVNGKVFNNLRFIDDTVLHSNNFKVSEELIKGQEIVCQEVGL